MEKKAEKNFGNYLPSSWLPVIEQWIPERQDLNYIARNFEHDPLYRAWNGRRHIVGFPDCNKCDASSRLFKLIHF